MVKHETMPAKLLDGRTVVMRTTVALKNGRPPSVLWHRGARFAYLSTQGGVAIYKREGVTK